MTNTTTNTKTNIRTPASSPTFVIADMVAQSALRGLPYSAMPNAPQLPATEPRWPVRFVRLLPRVLGRRLQPRTGPRCAPVSS
jgi:hypothetical protein